MLYSLVDKVYISESKIINGGRGVFAKVDIKKGELIESCPVIQIPKEESSMINQTMLVNYIYYLGSKKDKLILVLGFGSIYNHCLKPNAKYEQNLRINIVNYIALRDIKSGEEILLNYNQGSKTKAPLWFEVSS